MKTIVIKCKGKNLVKELFATIVIANRLEELKETVN